MTHGRHSHRQVTPSHPGGGMGAATRAAGTKKDNQLADAGDKPQDNDKRHLDMHSCMLKQCHHRHISILAALMCTHAPRRETPPRHMGPRVSNSTSCL